MTIATETPQESINRGLPRPSECDIVVVLLWSRMGTPLPFPEYRKPDGGPYLSGTEWEYEDAIAADVHSPLAFVGSTHVTGPERAALADLRARGLHDVVRDRWPTERVFTYWDYRAGRFHQDLGMRIDLILASTPVADRVRAAWVDRHARKGTAPSDHAPVIADLDTAPDGGIGPVVPPPSTPARRH